ncbi:PREDICTED: vomeronasal type-1 receptor 1-like [Galeopterus variegatus]|uniref:Vomeronasal type-1 receptor n=1 Tax=Galeopterus variegatus TaxID=482537 RepID=A0ABM0RZ42_GALVR|nr:PREDICTED: vomeronasal type-1 receptor 1-like [Galeopterus variegatus]
MDRMGSETLEMGIIFLTQTGIGILGNSFLLCLYIFILLTEYKLRHIDLILKQLVLANLLVLFSKGVPQTMAAFGLKYFLNDAGCKVVFYFHRVATGVSFSTVCLFNGFQVIKLNSSVCRRLELKMRSLKFIGFCCCLCWILHLMINAFVPITVNGPLNSKNLSVKTNYGHCSWNMRIRFKILNMIIYFSPEIMSLGFMIWASIFMVVILLRHKRRVCHIHGHRLSPRPSHEARATYIILILVSSFVSLYSFSTISTISMTLFANPGQWMMNSFVVVTSCFPTFSPFVLISSYTRVSQLCFAQCAKKSFFS